jgi:serine/threonine-protein kinase
MTVKKRPPAADIVTLASPPIPLAAGEAFADQYIIEELYGSGPLGFTYRGRDVAGSQVAIKIVARELVPTEKERATVVQEVQKLHDREMPRVAVPIDAGIASGVAYVVTPWVKGRSLRRVLGAYRDAARVMPHEEVLGVIEGVVQALRQLHTVASHGALYPESIQIASDGRIILTDAGIAASMLRARLVEHFERYPDVLAYLSPEIRAGKASNAGSDLYSVGALASELLTGDPSAPTE